MRRTLSYFPAATALLLLASCAGAEREIFTGPVTPLSGTCDPQATASLLIVRKSVQFAIRQGVLVLEGTIAPDGAIQAGLDTPGMDRKPYHLAFTGHRAADAVTGTVVTPRCRYAVALHRIGA